MLDASIIQAMVASGCSVETLAAAVLASQELVLAKRVIARARQRVYRGKVKQNQHSCHSDIGLQGVTVLPPCPPSPPDKEKVSIPLKEINLLSPLNPPSPLSGVVRNGNFAAFWELFPNKVGRRKAEERFHLALKRASLDQIMAGLAEYIAKTDDRPWCNPATWLNQDRWEDQPAPQVKSSAKPLTFAQANYLRNQELIHAALGPKPGPVHQTEPVRRALGTPTLRLVPVIDSDAVEF